MSADLTGPIGGSGGNSLSFEAPLAAPFELAALRFSATVAPTASLALVDLSPTIATDRVDSALLLLAATADEAESREGDDDAAWLCDQNRDEAAIDLVLASAFDKEDAWWKSL